MGPENMATADVLNAVALLFSTIGAVTTWAVMRKFALRRLLSGFASGYVAVFAVGLLYLIVTGSEQLAQVMTASKVQVAFFCVIVAGSSIAGFLKGLSDASAAPTRVESQD